MNIIFIAPPAAGKGTQSAKVSREYGIPHVSSGDLLRNSEDKSLQNDLKQGMFVSDELITNLLQIRLTQNDCDKGYVLDGYPRNLKQAKLYEDLLSKLHKEEGIVIVLDLDEASAAKRVIGRKTCPNCGEVFNDLIKNSKPKEKDICDYCHHKLVKREDDNEITFKKRYELYQNETMPLIKYYEEKGIACHISSGINQDYTYSQIEKIIGGLYDKH